MSKPDKPLWRVAKKAASFGKNFDRKRKVHRGNFTGKKVDKDDWVNVVSVCLQKGLGALSFGSDTRSDDTRRVAVSVEGTEFTVEEHLPATFAGIRTSFGVNPIEYKAVLGIGPEVEETNLRHVSTSEAAGKSMAWFMFSNDMRYVLKSCEPADVKCLLKIVASYAGHVRTSLGTLLPHFLGLYAIRWEDECITVLVQQNVFAAFHEIVEKYDLKGAVMGRRASKAEKAKGTGAVLKDLDFLGRGRSLAVRDEKTRAAFVQKIDRDSAWCQSQGLMDYSLIVGFAKNDNNNISRFVIEALPLDSQVAEPFDIAYVGIVDILMMFNTVKWVECKFLHTFYGDVSCLDPPNYAKRFATFVHNIAVKSVDPNWQESRIKDGMSCCSLECGKKDFLQAKTYDSLGTFNPEASPQPESSVLAAVSSP